MLDFLDKEFGLIVGLILGVAIGRLFTIPMWEADLTAIAGVVIAHVGNRLLKRKAR
jgi:hypothetical protein